MPHMMTITAYHRRFLCFPYTCALLCIFLEQNLLYLHKNAPITKLLVLNCVGKANITFDFSFMDVNTCMYLLDSIASMVSINSI